MRSIANKGFKLIRAVDLIMPDVIHGHLRTSFLGRTIFYSPSTASTNEDAKMLDDSCPDGTLLVAETQTGGKGRIGRHWSSPRGGIFMSALLRPPIQPSRVPSLSIVAGYSVATAIRETLGLDARLKWPNDVLIDGRKVCGILCEMRAEPDRAPLVVVGIGVNANLDVGDLPEEVREAAASLKSLLERDVDRSQMIAAILNRFEPAYRDFLENGLSSLAPHIQEISAFVGEPVVLRNLTATGGGEIHGTFLGIDPDGRALVKTPGGESLAFSAGDLSLRSRPT